MLEVVVLRVHEAQPGEHLGVREGRGRDLPEDLPLPLPLLLQLMPLRPPLLVRLPLLAALGEVGTARGLERVSLGGGSGGVLVLLGVALVKHGPGEDAVVLGALQVLVQPVGGEAVADVEPQNAAGVLQDELDEDGSKRG